MAHSKKVNSYKAYIENQRIKIISEDGLDFQANIQKNLDSQRNYRFLVKTFFALGCVFGSLALSNLFGAHFTKGAQETFGMLTFFLSLATMFTFDEIKELSKKIDSLNHEYNIAKSTLQKDIMELEKELISHTQELQSIKAKKSMDFSNNFKKPDQSSYM